MSHLEPATFRLVAHSAPLIAVDLLVRDRDGQMLLGRRVNPPAKNYWFAPGGRIRKGETLDQAFERVSRAELGSSVARSDASLVGVYDHFYAEDFTGEVGPGTHYVVLAYALQLDPASLQLPMDQHSAYRWVAPREGRHDVSVGNPPRF
jgi:colanic acid biosynthesis protein WcaH